MKRTKRQHRAEPKPFQQGGLDYMCGVYAVVNGVRLCARPYWPMGHTRAASLFADLCWKLDHHGKLWVTMTEGMGDRYLQMLLRRAQK